MTRLVLIGAAGLDWASFVARLKRGSLVNLSKLSNRGVSGWIGGAPRGEPLASWASLASGYPPETHGIYRWEEAWSAGVRPVSKASWMAAPIWQRLDDAGISTGGIAWPASRPGENWGGIHLDPDIVEPSGKLSAEWALPLGCAPPPVRTEVRDLRVHPTSITAAMLAPLVPDIGSIDQTRDADLPRLAVAMARAATVQAMAVWMLTNRQPEASFIHQQWLGEVRTQCGQIREGPFAKAMDGAWLFLDRLVGRIADLAGPDTLVFLVSPGWRGRPGVIIGAGPGVKPDTAFNGADLLDVAPTLLAHFKLEDLKLPGKAILQFVDKRPRDPAPKPCFAAPIQADVDLLDHVKAEGYSPPPPPDEIWHAQGLAELAYTVLPRSPEAARDLAQAALVRNPDNIRALAIAALSHVTLGEADPLPSLADAFDRLVPERKWGALARGAYHVILGELTLAAPLLREAETNINSDMLLRVAGAWLAASRPLDAERVFQKMLSIDPEDAAGQIGLSITALRRLDYMGAEAALRRALRSDPGRPIIYLLLANIFAKTGRKAQSAETASQAVRLGADPQKAKEAIQGQL